mmetsp:Transcript_13967/g.38381  ORF Transcript_13967/g.38381 Transcript_13967/m.38381 type:complete len:265 (+) Transcript_13967:99-893(+)
MPYMHALRSSSPLRLDYSSGLEEVHDVIRLREARDEEDTDMNDRPVQRRGVHLDRVLVQHPVPFFQEVRLMEDHLHVALDHEDLRFQMRHVLACVSLGLLLLLAVRALVCGVRRFVAIFHRAQRKSDRGFFSRGAGTHADVDETVQLHFVGQRSFALLDGLAGRQRWSGASATSRLQELVSDGLARGFSHGDVRLSFFSSLDGGGLQVWRLVINAKQGVSCRIRGDALWLSRCQQEHRHGGHAAVLHRNSASDEQHEQTFHGGL